MKVIAKKEFQVIRIQEGYSISELAKKSNTPIATISRIEKGKPLSPKSAKKLCEALQKDFGDLFKIENEEDT